MVKRMVKRIYNTLKPLYINDCVLFLFQSNNITYFCFFFNCVTFRPHLPKTGGYPALKSQVAA